MHKTLIAPSILAADFGKLDSELKSCEESGADLIHIDVMDGIFVPRISFGDIIVAQAKKSTKLFLEVHLMTVEPYDLLRGFVEAGANRLIIHQETCPHLYRDLEFIKELGCSTGVAINPSTPVNSIKEILHLCDVVLVMTVNPGKGGQKFIPQMIGKISEVKELIKHINPSAKIGVDGGVNEDTAKKCVKAGADILIAGSYFFNSIDRKQAIEKLKINDSN